MSRAAGLGFVARWARAQVVEQADTLGLNPSDFGRTGSSPVLGTRLRQRFGEPALVIAVFTDARYRETACGIAHICS